MSHPIKFVLSRWELDPPTFSATEFTGEYCEILTWLEVTGIVCSSHMSATWTCSECSERCQLTFVNSPDGQTRVFAACRRCGPVEIPASHLQRRRIQTAQLLERIFVGHQVNILPIVPNALWRVGRARWAGRTHEIWFVRGVCKLVKHQIITTFERYPRSVLFTATERAAVEWRRHLHCRIIALESVLTWIGPDFKLDDEQIELGIGDLDSTSRPDHKPRPRRAIRAAKIELLRRELTEHLQSACDFAAETLDQTGEAKLLPRPTQEQLAKRLGLTKCDVSRCLKDPSSKELQLLWVSATDVYEVLKLRPLLSRRR